MENFLDIRAIVKEEVDRYIKQLSDNLWDAFAEDKDEAGHYANKSRAITLDRYGRRTSWMSEDAYIVYLPTAEVVEIFKNYWQETANCVDKPTTYIRVYSGDDWLFLPTTTERDCHTNKIREIDKLLGLLWDYAGIGKGDR